jgi:hypothetical protein
MTCLIPNRRRKKGIVRIKSVSEICDIDKIIAGYFTAIVFLYASTFAKSWRNVSPYALVNCNAAPRSNANTKNIAVFAFLNREKAFSPNASIKDLL